MTDNELERFSRLAVLSETGCINWTGNTTANGYGYFLVKEGSRQTSRYVHRVSYQYFVGSIPDGLQLDHLCRNRRCVNPSHLEPVTSKENTLRGTGPTAANAKKTHCTHGHEFNERNTRTRKGNRPGRDCRVCNRLRMTPQQAKDALEE